ncbi:polysaccharide deacetylase family protein [Lentibacter algarum]|uniref:polysaccharide deacetylase family protein n=1 Tax=Lentibacter algarum TaxID=576131 RepID=UPI001C06C193|nr:polysaccharide deacetylase family protein [Lentibacter algarum]MBU2981384.1 polysaccharide deacetylase family protein [Lentibacter algarum]
MSDWQDLKAELKIWQAEGLSLPFWWRDDDAIAATPALERLGALARSHAMPVHIAVIPSLLEESLVQAVNTSDTFKVLTHGWAHKNHALSGKKCEFGGDRPLAVRQQEARDGRDILQAGFGANAYDVFVPPWNRIADDLTAELPTLGYEAISTFTPRSTATTPEGLHIVNTHLDPIDWRGTRDTVPPAQFAQSAAALLQARRMGKDDSTEPLGLLTHHLVHTADIWHTVEAFLDVLMAGPVEAVHPFS